MNLKKIKKIIETKPLTDENLAIVSYYIYVYFFNYSFYHNNKDITSSFFKYKKKKMEIINFDNFVDKSFFEEVKNKPHNGSYILYFDPYILVDVKTMINYYDEYESCWARDYVSFKSFLYNDNIYLFDDYSKDENEGPIIYNIKEHILYNYNYEFFCIMDAPRIHYNDSRMNIGSKFYVNNNTFNTIDNNISIYYNDRRKITSYIIKKKENMNTYIFKYKYTYIREDIDKLDNIIREDSKIEHFELRFLDKYINISKIRINYEYCYKNRYLYI
jgi:hypothetical protein